MIARVWHGRVPSDKAEAYHAFLVERALPDYAAVPGHRGTWIFLRREGPVAHVVLTTLWDSREAVARFAGVDPERARYYPEDDGFLLEREPTVTHYEVLPAEKR